MIIEPIQLFLCGGTIDKKYFPEREVFDFEITHTNQMLNQSRISEEITFDIKCLFLKDSLDMTHEDRVRVSQACQQSPAEHILIMHGTSTMVETANAIAENIEHSKTVVLFGAMLPYELTQSDALFNFGTALSAVQISQPGIYIAMNGKIWKHNAVVKNEIVANFESREA